MINYRVGGWLWLAVTLSACHREPEERTQSTLVIEGESIKFVGGKLPPSLAIAPVSVTNGGTISLSGRVVWNEDRTVRVFTPFSGHVTRILAQPGDTVTVGQPLAMLESPDYGAAQADHRKALAANKLAAGNLQRVRDLCEHGVLAEKDLQQAEADAAAAAAEQQRTEHLLRVFGGSNAVVDQKLTLRSPIAGVVVERSINPGQELRPDQGGPPQYVITDPTTLWLLLDAREDDVAMLQSGCRFTFHIGSHDNDTFEGVIERVADFVDPATRTIKVLAKADNPDRRLKGDLFLTANIPVAGAAEPQAPASAIFLLGDKHFAFVRDGESFVRRQVEVGPEQSGSVPILAGVKAGDVLVTQGVLYLQQTLLAHAAG
jgi:cobalt-zinc-cadmium efflux system membrane fusion protein